MKVKVGKILVADDQGGVRKLLYEVFRREGYEVTLAGDGQTALEMVQEDNPDLILLDVKMPGIGGLETLRRLREQGFSTCVILITAYGETEVVEEALALGVVKHITKPFDINDLRNSVNRILRQRQSC